MLAPYASDGSGERERVQGCSLCSQEIPLGRIFGWAAHSGCHRLRHGDGVWVAVYEVVRSAGQLRHHAAVSSPKLRLGVVPSVFTGR